MGNATNPLAARLERAADVLAADRASAGGGSGDVSLLQYLSYDDGDIARAEGRARMLRAAAKFRRMFLLPVPDAPGLIFFGGEADPAIFGKRYEGLPVGNLAGSGTTSQRAFESCVGEGIEYLSQFVRDEDPVEVAPLAARLPSYAKPREVDVRRFVSECLAAGAIDAERPISWVMAKCLSDGASIWFPLDLCYRRSATDQDFSPRLKLSSGCAAGPSIEAATLRALLELVERDAVALWWRGGRRGRSIPADGEAGAAAAGLLAELRQSKAERTTWLLDITTDVEIPAVVALSAASDGLGFSFGFGARLTLAEAARAAIFELCQVELGQHVVAAKRQESGDAALTENDRRQLRRGTQFDARNCRLLQVEDSRDEGRDISLSSLQQALDRLQSRGIAAYAINLTRAEFEIPVVRVLAPGLQLEPCEIVGPRLSRMIDTTGGGARHHGGMPLL